MIPTLSTGPSAASPSTFGPSDRPAPARGAPAGAFGWLVARDGGAMPGRAEGRVAEATVHGSDSAEGAAEEAAPEATETPDPALAAEGEIAPTDSAAEEGADPAETTAEMIERLQAVGEEQEAAADQDPVAGMEVESDSPADPADPLAGLADGAASQEVPPAPASAATPPAQTNAVQTPGRADTADEAPRAASARPATEAPQGPDLPAASSPAAAHDRSASGDPAPRDRTAPGDPAARDRNASARPLPAGAAESAHGPAFAALARMAEGASERAKAAAAPADAPRIGPRDAPLPPAPATEIRAATPPAPAEAALKPFEGMPLAAPGAAPLLDALAPDALQAGGPGAVATDPGLRAASGQPAQPFAPAAPVRQILEAVVTARTDQLEIALSPEELGRVRITISQADGGLTVHLAAERDDTLGLLRRHAADLGRAFAEMGLGSADIAFGDGRREPAPAPDRRAAGLALGLPGDIDTSPSPVERRMTLSGRMDLRL